MAIKKAKFAQANQATDVLMEEPFNCVMSLFPLKQKIRARWAEMAGYVVAGKTVAGDMLFRDASPVNLIKANEWILKKIVNGWQGFMVVDADGIEEPFEFSEKNLEEIAQHDELVSPILDAAAKLAGREQEEDEKN